MKMKYRTKYKGKYAYFDSIVDARKHAIKVLTPNAHKYPEMEIEYMKSDSDKWRSLGWVKMDGWSASHGYEWALWRPNKKLIHLNRDGTVEKDQTKKKKVRKTTQFYVKGGKSYRESIRGKVYTE